MPREKKKSKIEFVECSVQGCNGNAKNPYGARGMCCAHYKRLRRHGDPLKGNTRFGARWAFLDKALFQETDECLFYPHCNTVFYQGKNISVYRFVCILAKGAPEDPKMEAAHECGNGHMLCINKRHLSWKTRKENINDMFRHGTKKLGDSHHASLLSEKLVRQLRLTDEPTASFARRHGLSYHSVYHARFGLTWKHVK